MVMIVVVMERRRSNIMLLGTVVKSQVGTGDELRLKMVEKLTVFENYLLSGDIVISSETRR